MGFRIVKIVWIPSQTSKKIEEHFYSSLKLVYTFITHTKIVGGPLLAALAAAMCSLLLPNCEVLHSMRLLSLIANCNEFYACFAFT